MKKLKIAFIPAIILISALGGFGLARLSSENPGDDPARLEKDRDAALRLLAESRQTVKRQNAEINELRAHIRSLQEQPPVAAQTPPAAQPTAEEIEEREQKAREERRERMIANFIERRSRDLGLRLGLDDAKTEAVAAVFSQAAAHRQAMRLFNRGEGDPPEPFSLDDALAEVLTPEEYAEYQAISERQLEGQLEVMATSSLSRLNTLVPLSEDQKDAIYPVLYDLQNARIEARENELEFDYNEALQSRLESLLTPEQAEEMRLYLENNPGALQGRGPGWGGGGRGPGG